MANNAQWNGSMEMTNQELSMLVNHLTNSPKETELIEFKQNYHGQNELGERISALSNSACYLRKPFAYLVYGVVDGTHEIIGTDFESKKAKVKTEGKNSNEELEPWLLNRLKPRIDFQSFDFVHVEKKVRLVVYKIPAAMSEPVKFLNCAYIRINSSTRKLSEYPEKEKQIWNRDDSDTLLMPAKTHLSLVDIPRFLSTERYFNLMGIPYPTTLEGVVSRFKDEKLVIEEAGAYSITNLGALLFANDLRDFDKLSRKSVRVIKYTGKNKLDTEREYVETRGYALCLESLIAWIEGQLPENEVIENATRRQVKMFPQIAIRELLANSIVHQDFCSGGFPTVEIYSDRLSVSNPGRPIIQSDRFIDEYYSRNDRLADIMRRMGFCEEKGSGLDKTLASVELFQLPPLGILEQENRTIVTIYAFKELKEMDKEEKIRACYQHACLMYVSNESMTNQSLRKRFKIEEHNSAKASRILRDAVESGKIKEIDPESQSRKYKKYVPYWA